jgi:glycosyltransferase involved in cell wall biosynthesis
MKILQIVNPAIPFPAKTVGGTERVVEYLINELLLLGHDITLMAHNDSIVPKDVKFIPIGTFYDQKSTLKIIWKHLLITNYDVIHNHGRLIYFLPKIWSKVKKVHTLHLADLGEKTFKLFFRLKPKNIIISPCAKWIQEKYSDYPGKWKYVNNGIPLNLYSYTPTENKKYLIIIARMDEGKGITDAIQIATLTNQNLVIAGKIGDTIEEKKWFNEHVLKYCDDQKIKFIGPVDDIQKQKLLQSAAALLMLTKVSEAFNLTMVEANANGCPVITYNKYFSPYFIKNGVNGYIGNTHLELIEKLKLLELIDRDKCRKEFELNYTSEIMTNNYLKIYTS